MATTLLPRATVTTVIFTAFEDEYLFISFLQTTAKCAVTPAVFHKKPWQFRHNLLGLYVYRWDLLCHLIDVRWRRGILRWATRRAGSPIWWLLFQRYVANWYSGTGHCSLDRSAAKVTVLPTRRHLVRWWASSSLPFPGFSSVLPWHPAALGIYHLPFQWDSTLF